MKMNAYSIALGLNAVALPTLALYATLLLLALVVGCGSTSPTASPSEQDPSVAKELAERSSEVELLVKSFSQALTVLVLQTSDAGPDDRTVVGYVEDMKSELFRAYMDLEPDRSSIELGHIQGDIDELTAAFIATLAEDLNRAGEARDRLTQRLVESMT